MQKKVYIVLVNWNGWRDTIECLASVFRLDYSRFAVIVCDNASEDGSLDKIEEWARGSLAVLPCEGKLQQFVDPPYAQPVPYLRVTREDHHALAGRSEKLFLLQTGDNLGFAGGNNAGLRLALAAGDLDYAWLLNNDTVVDRAALSALVERMESRPDAGMCGSTLVYYRDPDVVQAFGGSSWNPLVARGYHIGAGPMPEHLPAAEEIERKMKYVVGASMLVSKAMLDRVGLMNESYFLYGEELDWATRAKNLFGLAYAPESLVYHKEGGSIGTAPQSALQPAKAEYYGTRTRLLLTQRFYPLALPSVLAAVIASFFHRLLRRRPKNARAILRGAYDAFQWMGGKA